MLDDTHTQFIQIKFGVIQLKQTSTHLHKLNFKSWMFSWYQGFRGNHAGFTSRVIFRDISGPQLSQKPDLHKNSLSCAMLFLSNKNCRQTLQGLNHIFLSCVMGLLRTKTLGCFSGSVTICFSLQATNLYTVRHVHEALEKNHHSSYIRPAPIQTYPKSLICLKMFREKLCGNIPIQWCDLPCCSKGSTNIIFTKPM